MKKLGKITTPKRKLYYFKRKLNKHYDLIMICLGLTALIALVIFKLLK